MASDSPPVADAPPDVAMFRRTPRAADVTIPVALLAGLVAIGAADGGVALRVPLWLDEVHTAWIAERPRIADIIDALRQGADFNPPLLFIWHWLIARLTDGVNPIVLKVTAGLSMWLGLVLIYRLLRRSYEPLPALVGVTALAGSGLLMEQLFEARFYGPWLLLTALYVRALASTIDSPGSTRMRIAAACAASLLCLIHYFGVITLTLATAGAGLALLLRRQSLRVLIAPMAAGLVTMLLLSPLLLGQRAALSGPVWIEPACCVTILVDFVERFVAMPQVAIVLAVAAAALLFPPLRARGALTLSPQGPDPALAAMLATGLLPVVLVGIELIGQPVLVDRYALPSLLMAAGLAAAAASILRPAVQVVCLLVVLAYAGLAGRANIQQARRAISNRARERAAAQIAITRARSLGTIVIVPTRFRLYPLLNVLPASESSLLRLAQLPNDSVRRRFPLDSDSASAGSMILMEQNEGLVHQRVFGRPAMLPVQSVSDSTCYLLIDDDPRPGFAARWMPHHHARRLAPLVYLLEPMDASGNSRACGVPGASG